LCYDPLKFILRFADLSPQHFFQPASLFWLLLLMLTKLRVPHICLDVRGFAVSFGFFTGHYNHLGDEHYVALGFLLSLRRLFFTGGYSSKNQLSYTRGPFSKNVSKHG